jgi:tryptophan synthase alpha chain
VVAFNALRGGKDLPAFRASMNTRIDQAFARLKAEGKTGFIPYITAGDPGIEETEDIVYRLEDIGADIIELGIPFSDPLADGTANQLANDRALEAGTTLPQIFEMVGRIRERSEIPLLFYSYINPLYAPGVKKTLKKSAKIGVDGVLLVDMSVEESGEFREALDANHLNNINLVTPTTPEERIKAICDQANGFVYCVSREGITGEQSGVQQQSIPLLKRTHRYTDLPIALGFGVSTPAIARAYAELTEAVVVGSYIVNQYFEAGNSAKGRAKATRNIKKLVDAVKEV